LTCLGDRSNIPLTDRLDVRKEHELQVHSQGFSLLPCVKPFGPLHSARCGIGCKRWTGPDNGIGLPEVFSPSQ
jgi:hypothetical protein